MVDAGRSKAPLEPFRAYAPRSRRGWTRSLLTEAVLSASTFPTAHASGVPYGELFDTACKEQINLAYVHAVATAARCSMERRDIDYQGVDATIQQSAPHNLLDTVSLDIQLKCTSQPILSSTHVAYSIETKYYDQLRTTRRLDDFILVVMLVPPDLTDWVQQSESALHIAKAAYWINLRGRPAVTTNTTTVHIPRSNVFNVEQLLGMLSRIGSGKHA